MASKALSKQDPRVHKAAFNVAIMIARGRSITKARALRPGQAPDEANFNGPYVMLHHNKGPDSLKPGDCIDAHYRLLRIDDTGERWLAQDLRSKHEVVLALAAREKYRPFVQFGGVEARLVLDNGEAIPEVSIAGERYYIHILDPQAMLQSLLAWRGEIHLDVVPALARIELAGQVFKGEAHLTDLPEDDYPVHITCDGYQDVVMKCQPTEALGNNAQNGEPAGTSEQGRVRVFLKPKLGVLLLATDVPAADYRLRSVSLAGGLDPLELIGPLPEIRHDLPAGRYELQSRASSGQSLTTEVVIEAGRATAVRVCFTCAPGSITNAEAVFSSLLPRTVERLGVRFMPVLARSFVAERFIENESQVVRLPTTISYAYWIAEQAVNPGRCQALVEHERCTESPFPTKESVPEQERLRRLYLMRYALKDMAWTPTNRLCSDLNNHLVQTGVLRPGEQLDLPTEAEWELAFLIPDYARRGAPRRRPLRANSREAPLAYAPLLLHPNRWGLLPIAYGEHQNLIHGEWCRDWYDPASTENGMDTRIDPTGPESGERKVFRGITEWDYDSFCRSGWLTEWHHKPKGHSIDFRPVIRGGEPFNLRLHCAGAQAAETPGISSTLIPYVQTVLTPSPDTNSATSDAAHAWRGLREWVHQLWNWITRRS